MNKIKEAQLMIISGNKVFGFEEIIQGIKTRLYTITC